MASISFCRKRQNDGPAIRAAPHLNEPEKFPY